jgi:[acyl-carrier-protein] S-malonyltransferase
MGKQLHDARASVRALFDRASDLLSLDLRELCFEGPAPVLAQTENVQPAITLVSLSAFHALREEGISPDGVAGHSLGEYAALCAAGVLGFESAMELVRFRGLAMSAAANANPGGMVAVFGLERGVLDEICAQVGSAGVVEVANVNSPSQVVLSGDQGALTEASRLAKSRGAKLTIRLKVSGPWHSSLMETARAGLREKLDQVELRPASCPVYCNVTGRVYQTDTGAIRSALVDQLIRPVLWSDIVGGMVASGYGPFVEAGPGKVLSGLLKESQKEALVISAQDEDTIAQCRTEPRLRT